jgi:hypothetical protein
MIRLALLITTVALFMTSPLAISGSSGESTAALAAEAAKTEPAQGILNKMACKDKEPGEQVKDQTTGKMIICAKTKKTRYD